MPNGSWARPAIKPRCTSLQKLTTRRVLCLRVMPSAPTSRASVAFADVDRRPRQVTADRTSFLGRHGSVAAPAALASREFPGQTGAALDPCAAIQVAFDLEPGAETQIVFLLGEADGPESARALIRRYNDKGSADDVAAGDHEAME